MPTFWYRALGDANVPAEGTISAATRRDALQRLIEAGHHPLDLKEHEAAKTVASSGIRFRRRAIRLATFTQQLATLSSSGAPIVKGLSVIAEQTKDPLAKQILSEVSESVKGGSTFADALAMHPKTFPQIMTSMVRVGEMGGTLDEQLLQLSVLYEKEEELKGEV